MNHYRLTTPLFIADIYNCGTYGSGSYDNNDACQSQSPSQDQGQNTSAGTPNTGYAPGTVMGIGLDLVIVGGLAIIVLAASAYSLLRRKKKNA